MLLFHMHQKIHNFKIQIQGCIYLIVLFLEMLVLRIEINQLFE